MPEPTDIANVVCCERVSVWQRGCWARHGHSRPVVVYRRGSAHRRGARWRNVGCVTVLRLTEASLILEPGYRAVGSCQVPT